MIAQHMPSWHPLWFRIQWYTWFRMFHNIPLVECCGQSRYCMVIFYCVRLPELEANAAGSSPLALRQDFCLSLLETMLIIGFFFQSDMIGWSASYNLFAKSSINSKRQRVSGRPEASKWTYPFFVQSRFYLDIPQVSHLPSIGPFLLALSFVDPFLRRFLVLGFFW
jgi:hypothetical protein